ncbi:MAG: SDR family NAD(P)-dependent oxidoreductase [Candidatus Odinarchaeia archaeon]
MSKKVLVTGGAGFIGSHLVDRLLQRGDHIVIIDNLSSPTNKYYKRFLENTQIEFINGDIRHFSDVLKACEDVEQIFHLAADPRVDLSSKRPIENFEVNVIGTLNVMEAARQTGVKTIFFASSGGTVYGETEKIPTSEETPLKPISCYGASKACGEMYLSAYSATYNINSISLRFANVFGPRSNHGVMFDFYNKLKKNPNELLILGDGAQQKSYIYIDDCVDAILFIEKAGINGFECFNIGSEEWITVNEIAKLIVEKLNIKNVKFKYTGGKKGWVGDVPKMMLDISKIKRIGWKPQISFKEGLHRFIEYLESCS